MMADIHDVMAAESETNEALRSMDVYAGQVEEGRRAGNHEAVALATCLAGRAIALAIREASIRRDLRRSYGH